MLAAPGDDIRVGPLVTDLLALHLNRGHQPSEGDLMQRRVAAVKPQRRALCIHGYSKIKTPKLHRFPPLSFKYAVLFQRLHFQTPVTTTRPALPKGFRLIGPQRAVRTAVSAAAATARKRWVRLKLILIIFAQRS